MIGTSQIGLAAVVRAKAHDDWARDFLAAHPDAVVLHLGCGLDARVYRIDPPSTVDWYDLDCPPSPNCGDNSCRVSTTR